VDYVLQSPSNLLVVYVVVWTMSCSHLVTSWWCTVAVIIKFTFRFRSTIVVRTVPFYAIFPYYDCWFSNYRCP